MKTCRQCKKEFQGKRKDAVFCRINCKNNYHVTLARQKRKRDLVEHFGGKCVRCGYDRTVQALQFHHLDPSTKKFGLGKGNCKAWEKDLAEAEKCELICANCHAEEHY